MSPALSGLGAERLSDSGERVVITGAGGWAGLATLEMLSGLFGEAFRRRVACFGVSDRTLTLRDGTEVAQRPLGLLPGLRSAPSVVLHLAFLTRERFNPMSAEAYAAVNRAISDQVRAQLDSLGARAVFLGSSGAVYLTDDPAAGEAKRQYGALKRLDEARFARWASPAHRVAIGRVFNISGPYINHWPSYALSSFIADAQGGRPIAIEATNRVYRSYVALEELMSVVFGVLTDPGGGAVTFDTVGAEVVELDDLARAVQAALGVDVGVERPPLSDAAPDRYVGDGAIWRGLLAKYGVRHSPLAEQIRQTAQYMAAWPDPSDGEGEHL
jgi:nucleoside-diphosphate-sugar epimerase